MFEKNKSVAVTATTGMANTQLGMVPPLYTTGVVSSTVDLVRKNCRNL